MGTDVLLLKRLARAAEVSSIFVFGKGKKRHSPRAMAQIFSKATRLCPLCAGFWVRLVCAFVLPNKWDTRTRWGWIGLGGAVRPCGTEALLRPMGAQKRRLAAFFILGAGAPESV